MRSGMELLLDFLRGSQPMRIEESEGLALLRVADEENLLPWITAQLSSMSELPPAVADSAHAIHEEAQKRAFLWASGLRHILAAFHEHRIPVISLKGPWLAERLYGDTGLRCYSDLDLLVRPRDIPAAEILLSDKGFSPSGHREDRHRPWRDGDILIELHHQPENPLEFNLTSIWDRVQIADFHGVPALLLAPADELLFLCIHAVRHTFERLSLVFDLGQAFRFLPLPDLSAFTNRPRELMDVLSLSWTMARRLAGDAAFPILPSQWLETSSRMEKIADRLWMDIMLNGSRPASWLATHRLYVEIEARRWHRLCRRARNARILLGRITEADYLFAARFNLGQEWQARILRPFRLLLKSISALDD